MKKFGSKSGFTLVELIVVIAILGILAGIAVPAYSGYIKKANQATDYTQLDAIKTAAVFAYTDKHVNDTDFKDVTKIVVNGKTDTATASIEVYYGKTGETPTQASDVDVDAMKPYYDLTDFTFKSGATKATWNKSAVAAAGSTAAEDAGWTLTMPTT